MRVFGIIAIFVLTVVAIVEAAVLVRLSGRVDSLSAQLEGATTLPTLRVKGDERRASASLPGAPGPAAVRAALPRLVPAPPSGESPPAAAGPATAVLREALESTEGRTHLKNAIEVIREQDRQERIVRRAEENIADEQRERERLVRLAGLSSDEQNRVSQMHANLHTGRQRVLEEMRSGLKTSDQADNEIDELEDATDREVRALLGDARMQKFREASRAERRARRAQRGPGGSGGPPPPPGAPPAPTAATP